MCHESTSPRVPLNLEIQGKGSDLTILDRDLRIAFICFKSKTTLLQLFHEP